MDTIENPASFFRKIDATDVKEDGYEFHVAEEDEHPLSPTDSLAMTKKTVKFKDLTDPDDDFVEALARIEKHATLVEDGDIPENVDTQYTTRENGETVRYFADTDYLGYEVINSFDPRMAAYVVINEDALYKIHL